MHQENHDPSDVMILINCPVIKLEVTKKADILKQEIGMSPALFGSCICTPQKKDTEQN